MISTGQAILRAYLLLGPICTRPDRTQRVAKLTTLTLWVVKTTAPLPQRPSLGVYGSEAQTPRCGKTEAVDWRCFSLMFRLWFCHTRGAFNCGFCGSAVVLSGGFRSLVACSCLLLCIIILLAKNLDHKPKLHMY